MGAFSPVKCGRGPADADAVPASCLGVSWAGWREQVERAQQNEWAAEVAASGLERLAVKLTLTNLLH